MFCLRILLGPGAPVLLQSGRPSLGLYRFNPSWTGGQRPCLDGVFKSTSFHQGSWTPSGRNSDVVTLIGIFRATLFNCNCSFYFYYFVMPPQVSPSITIAPGQFLSSVDRNECRVSAFGAEASCGPFLSSHGLACHCCKKAFVMRLSPSQLVLSSFPLSSSASCILLPGGQV